MKRKRLKQHLYDTETGLCVYCGADVQECQLACDRAPDPTSVRAQDRAQTGKPAEPETADADLAIEVRVSKDRYEALTRIDLIASGYEFECPECLTYNTLTAIPKYGTAVECHYCHEQFQVDESNHAHD